MLNTRFLPLLGLCLTTLSCTSSTVPPLRGIEEPVDLERFMGSWYVIAAIPIHFPLLPLFSEKDAHNGVESYTLTPEGIIETTYTFHRGSFDGPVRTFRPRARVANPPVNSEWKMKFDWYLPAADFLILHLDADYRHTVIGVPDRKYVWIMSRTPAIPPDEYARLLDHLARIGYDTAQIVPVPQQWPAIPAATDVLSGYPATPAPGPESR